MLSQQKLKLGPEKSLPGKIPITFAPEEGLGAPLLSQF